MFFQIEDICAQHSDEAIRKMIGSLPRDLPATYQRALERVVRNNKAEVARKMFRWVAAAKRPLSLMEVREAIAVEPCQPFSQEDKLVNDVYQLIPWCGNLLVLDEEEGLVQFAHHSVKDYLLSGEIPESLSDHFRIEPRAVDQEAGEICCTYLNFSDFERRVTHFPQLRSGLDPEAIVKTSLSASSSPTMASSLLRLKSLRKARRATEAIDIWRQLHLTSLSFATMWPQNLHTRYYFLGYASEYWLHHTTKFNEKDRCWKLFRRLVLPEETTLVAKPWSMEEWKALDAKVENYIVKAEHHALLSLAVLEQQIPARGDLCRVINYPRSPLSSDELFQFHMNTTGLVEDFWSTWDPVLIMAAERGRLDWVKQVLELAGGFEKAKKSNPAPARMNTFVAQSWKKAWEQAECKGTPEMMDLLLTYKAIIRGRLAERGYEELYDAVWTRNLEVTKRLLDASVHPNVPQPPLFDSILVAAVSGGSFQVVETLLYAGAEVNPQTRVDESALVAAARRGEVLIVIALLAAGADVNADFGQPSLTPLAAAADHEVVMVLLLIAGALSRGSAGCHQFGDWVGLENDESIKRAKWLASLQYDFDKDQLVEYYRTFSSFPSKDRKFFDDMNCYVQYSCGTDMRSIKVKEAVEAFLHVRMKPKQGEIFTKQFFQRKLEKARYRQKA